MMTNKQYDTLKMIALILTPVLAFLASLTNIWHVPYAEQIVATLTALDTLIGAVVVVANKQYQDK
jgi:small basic protein